MAQISTSISDLILALSCLYCVRLLTINSNAHSSAYFYSKSGFILIMIAGSLGVFRFGMTFPPAFLINCHLYASFLASVLGLSCLAAEFHQRAGSPLLGQFHMYASLMTITLQWVACYKTHSFLSEFVSSTAVISILLICARNANFRGCLGAIAIIFAGLVVGTTGHCFGFPAVDLFHYVLVLANCLLVNALVL